MTRPILVFGAWGRVGGVLSALMRERNRAFVGIDMIGGMDITREREVRRQVETHRPAAIVNLAACTLPYAEQAEAKDEALAVNGEALNTLAGLGSSHGFPIVTLSTDCVFDGEMANQWREHHEPRPRNHYGRTKLAGEQALRDWRTTDHIIIRTTGVYLANKPNFLKLVVDKPRAGETIEVVSDSIYSPTDARELARAILVATERVIEDPSVSGTYHFAGPDVMSYLQFAKLVQE